MKEIVALAAITLCLAACGQEEDRPPNNYNTRAPDITEPPTGTPNNSPTTGESMAPPYANDGVEPAPPNQAGK